jgi:putative ABC transport system permease protein
MIGLALIVALSSVVTSLTSGFLGILRKTLASDYLLVPPAVAVWASNVGASASLADEIRALPGVDVVSTIRFAEASLDGNPVSLLGIDPAAFPRVSELSFLAGDASAYADLASGRSLIVNGLLAAQRGLRAGDTATFMTPEGPLPYRVAAVASDYLNAKVLTAYISQANLASDFGRTDDVFIQVNLADGAERDRAAGGLRAAAARYPQFRLVSGEEYYEDNRRIFDTVFVFFYAMLGLFAVPSLIAMLNTLAVGVLERTREIGILRAVGAAQAQVRQMVVAEALLLAGMGTSLGLLAGLYLGYFMVLAIGSAGFAAGYRFPLAGLIAAVATGLACGVLAAALPARRAARLGIVQALRYE